MENVHYCTHIELILVQYIQPKLGRPKKHCAQVQPPKTKTEWCLMLQQIHSDFFSSRTDEALKSLFYDILTIQYKNVVTNRPYIVQQQQSV